MKVYGIVLIGCGNIGRQHLMEIYHREDVRMVGVVDTDPICAQQAARLCGAAWDTDYHRFLSVDEVDIVIIATYTDSHFTIMKDCLAHHKHVLCEKPIARTLEEGRAFVEAVKAAPEKVLIAHILRHNQSYIRIRELIRSGAIGDLRLIRMVQNHHTIDWQRHRRLLEDCSPTVDCGVHYYDLVQWFTDSPIIEVSGFGTKTQDDAPRENHTLTTFRTESGVSGFYEVGWGQSVRACHVKEFVGTRGRVTLDMTMNRGCDIEEGDRITVYHSDTGVYETINLPSLYKDMYGQLKTLINMIESDTSGDPTIEDVFSAFRVALTAERSMVLGRPLTVDRVMCDC